MGSNNVRVGAVVSLTVTVNAFEPALAAASVEEQVMVVTPSGKTEPETRLAVGEETQVTVRVEVTASAAVDAAKVTVAPFVLIASTTWLAGVVMTGAVVSLTVTVKTFWSAALVAASCALHVIVVTPRGKIDPDVRPVVGEETQVTVTGLVTASVAETV